jgi:large subunit ribosomal protein L6
MAKEVKLSRIGKLPVEIPAGVTVTVKDNVVTVKGPKGELSQKVDPSIVVKNENGKVTFEVDEKSNVDYKQKGAYHGLYRALVHNMVTGVSKGFETKQELVGVGYRVAAQGQLLTFSLGYSHDIQLMLPKEVQAEVPQVKKGENPILILRSADKQLLGEVAAKVRSFRRPEPYKGKGIKFVGEQLRRKAGKTAAAK